MIDVTVARGKGLRKSIKLFAVGNPKRLHVVEDPGFVRAGLPLKCGRGLPGLSSVGLSAGCGRGVARAKAATNVKANDDSKQGLHN